MDEGLGADYLDAVVSRVCNTQVPHFSSDLLLCICIYFFTSCSPIPLNCLFDHNYYLCLRMTTLMGSSTSSGVLSAVVRTMKGKATIRSVLFLSVKSDRNQQKGVRGL
jgi:hypothetical protein